MKDKIIIFLIGLLLGAIISTGSIYFYTVANNSNNQNMQIPNGMPPSGQMNETPPDVPNNR